MSLDQTSIENKILEFLQTVAPNSIIDIGRTLANRGGVCEAGRSGRKILGVVKSIDSSNDTNSNDLSNDNDLSYSVTLEIVASNNLNATCTCSTDDEMQEQWCPHAIALAINAVELDLFSEHGGFASKESTYRILTSTPQLVAETLEELVRSPDINLVNPNKEPVKVEILLDTLSDRFGIQLRFNGTIQTPSVFEEISSKSDRSLDKILVQIVESKGSWDETNNLWYVNSGHDIDLIINLIKEYCNNEPQNKGQQSKKNNHKSEDSGYISSSYISSSSISSSSISSSNVIDLHTNTPIKIVDDAQIGAKLILNWTETGIETSMKWIIAEEGHTEKERISTIERTTDVFGTGPYWTNIDGTIYKLSNNAARIVGLFPNARPVSFARSETGPILEFILQHDLNKGIISNNESPMGDSIEIRNQNLAPKAIIEPPIPDLKLAIKSTQNEHFSSGQNIVVDSVLEFKYPVPQPEENIVYLPDRVKEDSCKELLKTLGFNFISDKKIYRIEGDPALDLISDENQVFPEDWEIQGLSVLKKSIKFSKLKFSLSLNSADQSTSSESTSTEKGTTKRKTKASKEAEEKTSDWFECNITLDQNSSHVPVSTIFKNQKGEDTRWIKLDNGSFARIPGGSLALLKTTLGMIDSSYQYANSIKTKISKAQALSLVSSNSSLFNTSTDKALQSLKTKLDNFTGIKTIKASSKFEGTLRNYQTDGISWINFLHDFEFGGILADEMGLGKTIQALAFIQALKESKAKEKSAVYPTLIVCPTSVLINWKQEAQKFTPNLKVLAFHGPQRKELFDTFENYDLIITSYALVRIDWPELKEKQFGYVILDEAQNIKNPQAATTKAVKILKAQRKIILTGTPTENRPLELWSLMDFLMPGYLGNIDFFKNFIEKPILEGRENNNKLVQFLNSKVKPFVLRRTKAQVEKDLPPKIESSVHTEMSQSQKELYLQILSEVKPQVFNEVAKKGVGGATVSILTALLRLRQVCNHPNSIAGLKASKGYDSGKFNLLKELVSEALNSGGRILIFSQFREMLRIIREWLEEEKIEHLYLDGDTKDRQPLVDKFNSDETQKVFLISLKAGGTGLNLTGADNVIIYDPWWNPAVENQAVDRAHRIGQKRTVNVYRLVTADTVEEKIMKLKDKKSKIVNAIMDGEGMSTLKLSKTDLEMLFEGPP